MLQGEHSAILLTFIKLPFVIRIFVLSTLEWPFYTCFTVQQYYLHPCNKSHMNLKDHACPNPVGGNRKRSLQSTNADQKSLAIVFSIVICRQSRSETLFNGF